MGRNGDKKARYLRLSGTSMAAAVTSGVVALMIQANREGHEAPLTPNAVKAILEYSALPLAAVDPLTQGAGGLNGAGAVLLAETIDPQRAVGAWWMTAPARSDDRDCRADAQLVADRCLGQHRCVGERRLREPRGLGANSRLGLNGRVGQYGCLGQHRSGVGRPVSLESDRGVGQRDGWHRRERCAGTHDCRLGEHRQITIPSRRTRSAVD